MDNYRWVIYGLVGAVAAAVVSVINKRALTNLDASVGVAVQSAAMLLTLVTIVTVLGRWSALREAPRVSLALMAGSGVVAAIAWSCGYRALQLSNVAKATPLDRLSLPIAVVLAIFFLHERPSGRNWVGIGLMIAGGYLVVVSNGK